MLPAAEVNSKPVPRLRDGKVDLTGPWVGGGTIADIERDGGQKPGELPLLPWARGLLEFICNEDNQYGLAGNFQPGTGAGNR